MNHQRCKRLVMMFTTQFIPANAPTATQEEIEADRNWEFRRLREDTAVTTSSHRGVLSFEQVVNAARAAMEEE